MFNVQVDRNDLFRAIEAVSSTVGNNSQNLGDDCISITDMGNFEMEIYTTNSVEFSKVNISMASGTASSSKPEKMPFVNFKRFKSMIESIPTGEYVTIKSNVNDIEITYGTRQKPLKLTGSSNGMIPLPTVQGINEITIDKNIIENSIKEATTIINDDATNALASCIRISCNSYNVEVTSIDTKNNRMYMHKATSTESNIGDVLIEGNKFKKALKLFTDFRDLNFESNNNVIKVFGSDINAYANSSLLSAEYYSRVLAGNYPTNISSMFDNISEYAKVNKDELKNSLIRINAIEDNTIGSGTMDLTIDNNFINIVKTSQYGTVEDSFGIENTITSPIKDTFKSKALAEILKNITDNASYGSPNTFEIGKKSMGNGAAYVLRETGNGDTMYLITGYVNASSNP